MAPGTQALRLEQTRLAPAHALPVPPSLLTDCAPCAWRSSWVLQPHLYDHTCPWGQCHCPFRLAADDLGITQLTGRRPGCYVTWPGGHEPPCRSDRALCYPQHHTNPYGSEATYPDPTHSLCYSSLIRACLELTPTQTLHGDKFPEKSVLSLHTRVSPHRRSFVPSPSTVADAQRLRAQRGGASLLPETLAGEEGGNGMGSLHGLLPSKFQVETMAPQVCSKNAMHCKPSDVHTGLVLQSHVGAGFALPCPLGGGGGRSSGAGATRRASQQEQSTGE